LENSDDQEALNHYLEVFRQNSDLDAILICDDQTPIGIAGDQPSPVLCAQPEPGGLLVDGQAWLVSSTKDEGHSIVIGQLAARLFEEFRSQTGTQYALFYQGQQLIPDSKDTPIDLETIDLQLIGADTPFVSLELDAQSYAASAINMPGFEEEGYQLIGLINTGQFTELNRQIRNTILVTLLLVSLVGIFVAVLLSRQISKPLNQLASSAIALSGGDLSTRLETTSKIWEIDQLSNALEDARLSLKHSLDQLRLERDWIENLLNAIVEGLITIDEKAHVTFASQGVESILGISPETLIGYPIDQFFISPDGEVPFSRQLPALNQNNKIAVRRNEGELLLSVSSSTFVPPEAGNATRALLIRDVTDEERIHRLMGEFMANITHEFRTPLAALSASVELLMDQLPELTLPETRELLNALNIGVINLQSLIDNLIEAASIEGGRFKVNPQPVALESILTDAVNTIKPIAEKHKLSIITPKQKPTVPVVADRRRTCQVLVNLLSNAVKHSPPDASITLSTSIVGDKVLVEVADQGQGVKPDQKPYLFNRYISPSQEGDLTQLGLGLGLSVVKAIIEAQNGEVGYRNRQRGGALFWFTLPLAERPSP
jgi:signal transduction histidine kinase/HAMP domain-containing protein